MLVITNGCTGITRNGLKVSNLNYTGKDGHPFEGCIHHNEYPFNTKQEWKEDGEFRLDGKEHDLDIVQIIHVKKGHENEAHNYEKLFKEVRAGIGGLIEEIDGGACTLDYLKKRLLEINSQ